MQDVTPWPASFDVSEPVARVLVDGQEVDVESVEVTSEMGSAMPERVAGGGGGIVAATGTTTILRADEVSEAGFNPWGDAQQFVNASEVVVEAGYRDPDSGGVGCARQITGQVESLDGAASSHSVAVDIVDYATLLDRDITIEPLLQEHPSIDDWGPRRMAGLSPIYVTDRILRFCGFYATPRILYQALLSAPMMGSVWPERGTLLAASAHSDSSMSAAFRPVPWGMALGNGVVSYSPQLGVRGHARLTSTLHVSFHRTGSTNPNPEGDIIDLRWGSVEDGIRINVMSTGSIVVSYRSGGTQTPVATLSASDVSESEAFTVLVSPSGDATIYASNGASATGVANLPTRVTSQSMDEVYVWVPQAAHPIGGLQVAFSDAQTHTFQRTAHIDPPAYHYSLRAFPAQVNVNCMALLKKQAEAELAAMWIDEFGHFNWRNRNQLRGTAPRGVLTSKHDLLDLPWQVPVRSVFSRVELEHDVPTVTLRTVPSITVFDNKGSTLSNGDTEERFIEPPANQDWHRVQPPAWLGGESFSFKDLRRGRGSYRGGVVVNDDNEEELSYSSRLDSTWTQIGVQRWLLSSTARNLMSDEYVEQRFQDRADLYGKYAGEDLPIIRAKGLVEWEKSTTVGEATGPYLSPVFVHEVGPWIQGTTELQSLANWLAEQLTKPDVILRRIPIVPDPRIQLGDVFWLEDQTAYKVRLRVVVMGKTLRYRASGSGYEMSQDITCRVIDVERLEVRYDELKQAWSGSDYGALESFWNGRDYDEFEADPLDRSEQ